MNKTRLGGQLQEYCYLAIIMPVIFKNCPKKEQGEGKADTIEYQGMIFDFVRPILFHSCLAGCKCLCCTCMVVSLDAFLVKSSCLSLQELRPAFDTILVLPFILSEVSVESSKRDP